MELIDIKSESLSIGYLYNDPKLFDSYGEKINPSLDYGNESTKFLYRLLYDCYLEQGKLTETAIKVFVDGKSSSYKTTFKDIGGIETLEKMRTIAVESINDLEPVYNKLKTYYVFRELNRNGIDVEKYYDSFKNEEPDFILENYEKLINSVSLNLKGVHNPENLGKNMVEFVEELQEHPDVGIELPYNLLNRYLRGLRPRTVNCIAAHTNRGKTRILTDILTHTSVFGNHKATLISTEMTEQEMKLQFLTSVYNKLFSGTEVINESIIATNNTTQLEKENLVKAAQFFEENCKIDFICINIYDYETLKRYIKQSDMKGTEIVAIDVLKPMRSGKQQVLQEWQQYPRTVEQLKELMIALDMTLLFTAQLTTQSVNERELDINNIANGTQISHVLDALLIYRDLSYKELESTSYIPYGCDENDSIPFDTTKHYMICKIAKNRGGMNGVELAMEVDRGAVFFNELGRFNKTTSVV